jgi:hypothetical protein
MIAAITKGKYQGAVDDPMKESGIDRNQLI